MLPAATLHLIPRHLAAALLTVMLSLSGCQLRPPPAATPTSSAPSPALATGTPPPTPRVILVAPAETPASLAQQAEAALQSLASTAQMEFVRQAALPGGELNAIALLVALPPDPGLLAWAQAHPEVTSAGLGIPGLQSTPNLSVIAPDGLRYDQLGFALGYLAALLTPEYRIGALARDASPQSLSLARGFVAGGTYYCGLCRPLHPPYLGYPELLDSAPIDPAAAGIRALLLAPVPTAPAEAGIGGTTGFVLMGMGEPSAQLAPLWLASADFDVAGTLALLWEATQTGAASVSLPLGIRLHSVDPVRVSPGRLALAEMLIAELVAGRVDTGIDPATGQPR
ncbi:MAG: hypothetical protein FJZ97_14165 [Chloroflexi bacterium]|nr:hypothetical protein [Chloroflexota bacterium]